MLHRFRFVISGTLVVLTSAMVSYAVSASIPNTLLPAGTTRYAFVTASGQVLTPSSSFVNLPGLSTSITIPAGQTGDVMIFFCGASYAENFTLVRALVGGSRASPPEVQLREGATTGSESQCANFVKKAVPAGTHTVTMQWRGPGPAGPVQFMYDRSVIVVVNLH